MPIHNKEIERVLVAMADLLDISGANESRVRVYRNAARTVESLPVQVSTLIEEGEDLSKYDELGVDSLDALVASIERGALPE